MGETLREYFRLLGISRSEIASALKISTSALSLWTTDRNLPSRNNVEILAELGRRLGVEEAAIARLTRAWENAQSLRSLSRKPPEDILRVTLSDLHREVLEIEKRGITRRESIVCELLRRNPARSVAEIFREVPAGR